MSTEMNELDAELEALRAQLPADVIQAPEPEVREMTAVDIALSKLAQFENGPDAEEIEEWIHKYGDEGVFMLSLAPEDTFVLRPVLGGEYKKIMEFSRDSRMRIAADDATAIEALDEKLKFLLVKNCLLWHPGSPLPLTEKDLENSRAGLLNNLVSVININSYFFPDPQQVLNFTTVLR